MPSNRKPRHREWRARFSPETLQLFRKLEDGPRRGAKFAAGEKALMLMLGLSVEFWGGCSVVGDREQPQQRHLASRAYWVRCQEVRRRLLEAVELSERAPATAAP